MPANWRTEELSEDREFIDAKFVSVKYPGRTMMYGSTDLWARLSASDKAGYVRSDLDNTAFTLLDIAEMIGTSAPVEYVEYNGKEYYQTEAAVKTEVYGLSLSLTTTHVIRIENGWIYWFQLSGSTENEYYDDFQQLVSSVHYPETSAGGNRLAVIVLVGIVAVIAVIAVAGKHKRRAPAQENAAPPQSSAASGMEKEYVFCHACGAKIK